MSVFFADIALPAGHGGERKKKKKKKRKKARRNNNFSRSVFHGIPGPRWPKVPPPAGQGEGRGGGKKKPAPADTHWMPVRARSPVGEKTRGGSCRVRQTFLFHERQRHRVEEGGKKILQQTQHSYAPARKPAKEKREKKKNAARPTSSATHRLTQKRDGPRGSPGFPTPHYGGMCNRDHVFDRPRTGAAPDQTGPGPRRARRGKKGEGRRPRHWAMFPRTAPWEKKGRVLSAGGPPIIPGRDPRAGKGEKRASNRPPRRLTTFEPGGP